jgi:hypothetical protein
MGSSLRDQNLFHVAKPPRLGQPEVARTQAIAQMKQDGDFPQTIVVRISRLQMTMPLRAWPQEVKPVWRAAAMPQGQHGDAEAAAFLVCSDETGDSRQLHALAGRRLALQ